MANNPLRYVDPSGHKWCDSENEGDCKGGSGTTLPTNLSDDELFQYFDDQPAPDDVPCLDYCQINPGLREKTYESYRRLRRALYDEFGWEYLTRKGKITDQALLAIIRFGEFGDDGTIKGSKKAYDESMEALANEYYSTHSGNHEAKCYGNCTLEEQLLWLQLIPSIREKTPEEYYNDTGVIGYDDVAYIINKGPYGDSWMWGNFTPPPGATITAGPIPTDWGDYYVYYP